MRTLKLYGCPGTGKTFTLLKYFEKELKTIKPNRIGFMTFTRAGRLEALGRTGMTEEELPYVKTLHAICYKVLAIDQNQLVLGRDLRTFGASIGVHLSGYTPDLFNLEAVTDKYPQPTKADRLLQINHLGRHRGLKLRETLKDAPPEIDFRYAKWFTQAYRDWKTANGKLDYTDLLSDYLAGGEPLDLDVLFVDEAQDLSWLQWQVVHKLASKCQRLYIAGDDDQAIFTWAGASASMFNCEPTDETVVLPQSYRLPRIVHEVSQKIIHRVKTRFEKEFRPRNEEGSYKPIGQLDVQHVSNPTTLVLYRNFHRGISLAAQLENLGVPFQGANATLSNPDVILALSGWHCVQENQPISMDAARAIVSNGNPIFLQPDIKSKLEGKTGEISATSLFLPAAFDRELYHVLPRLPRLAYLTRAAKQYGLKKMLAPSINLMSIHQSKGREAHTVVLDLEMARKTYESYLAEPDDEHRCWYVAVTRAKQELLTLLPSESMNYAI